MRRKRRFIHKFIFALFILGLLSLSGICIYYGIYFNNLANPRNIIGRNLDRIRDISRDYALMNLKYDVGDDFSVDGSVKFKLSSDLYYKQSATDLDSLKKFNYIKNLNSMESTFSYKQDKTTKKLYCDTTNKIGAEDIYSMKFYSDNSTKYYFVNGIVPNYVNEGNFNFFENYGEDITTKDNVKYLYDYMFTALKNAIPEEQISVSDVNQNYNGGSKYMHRVSIRVTNTVIKETLNNLLVQLRKDERANSIISNIYGDFAKFSFDDEKIYLEKDESYTFNIYTDRLVYNTFKYEIIYIHGNERKTYYFDVNEKGGKWVVVEGDNVLYNADVTINNDNTIDAVIYDLDSNNIGSLKLYKDNTGIDFSYLLDYKNDKREIIYSSKYSDVNKKHSYTNVKKLSMKIIDNNENRLSGEVEADTKVVDEVSIMEDTSSSVLYSTLSDDVKNKLDNSKDRIKERMEK